MRNQIASWEDFVTRLRRHSNLSESDDSIWKRVYAKKQKTTERVVDFFIEISSLFGRLSLRPSEDRLVEVVVDGVRSEVGSAIALLRPENLETLYAQCIALDRVCRAISAQPSIRRPFQPRSNAYRPQFQPRVASASESAENPPVEAAALIPVKCWNCSKLAVEWGSLHFLVPLVGQKMARREHSEPVSSLDSFKKTGYHTRF